MQCFIPADQHPSHNATNPDHHSSAAYQFTSNSNIQNYSHGQPFDTRNYRNHPNQNLFGSHENARGLFIRRKNHSRPAQHGSYARSVADYYSKTEIKVKEKYSVESNSVDHKYKIKNKNKSEEDGDTGSSSSSSDSD